MENRKPETFSLENFGPIKKAEVEFGDLTVLIGPQATGKSIFLQMFKWHYDSQPILNHKRALGFIWPRNVEEMLRLFLGESAKTLISNQSKLKGEPLKLVISDEMGVSATIENIIYVPANRDLIFTNNYIRNSNYGFQPLDPYILSAASGFIEYFLFVRYDKQGKLNSEFKDSSFWGKNSIYYSNDPVVHIDDQQKVFNLFSQ